MNQLKQLESGYLINDKWNVDIQNNKVERSYPDPDW